QPKTITIENWKKEEPRMKLVRAWTRIALTIGLGLVVALPSAADTITINLTNASFEASISTSCPVGWLCNSNGGTVGTYAPNNTDFSSPPFAPNGNIVAFSPSTTGGSVTLSQSITGGYVVGNTYQLSFFLGVPLGTTIPSVVRPMFLVGGT